ncbi:MAG: hypothetical protein PHY93_17685 [Bacteriovorax sp.]|nr:hypothetical protein [Bacteriovorax sp.]
MSKINRRSFMFIGTSVFITACLDARKSLTVTKLGPGKKTGSNTQAIAGLAIAGVAISGSSN